MQLFNHDDGKNTSLSPSVNGPFIPDILEAKVLFGDHWWLVKSYVIGLKSVFAQKCGNFHDAG